MGRSARSPATTYTGPLAKGDLSAAMSWSGDIPQIASPHIHWNAAKDGGAIWTDNMLIPKGGDVYTASVYMNYVYDPKVQGLMEGGDPKRTSRASTTSRRRCARGLRPRSTRGREQPAHLPDAGDARQRPHLRPTALNNEKYLTSWQNLISA
jgi:spermidine/putrescine-binding protein